MNTSNVSKAALAVGAVFLLVGILGFVPGITTDYDTMTFASHESEAKLLGIFQVSVLHNIVHLLFGVAGILASRAGAKASRSYLLGGAAIYLVLFLYGLAFHGDHSANFVPVNMADNILHLGLAFGMGVLGFVVGKNAETRNDITGRR